MLLNPDEYEDLAVMLDNVHAHVRATGRQVELDDDPWRRQLGYKDPVEGKTWRIGLTKVKAAISSPENLSRNQLAWDLMRTAEGRLQLANTLPPSD